MALYIVVWQVNSVSHCNVGTIHPASEETPRSYSPRERSRQRRRRSSNSTAPGLSPPGRHAARSSGRSVGPFSQSGKACRITPPLAPLPWPVTTSTTRTPAAEHSARKPSTAREAASRRKPCRSSRRSGAARPRRNLIQLARSRPAGGSPTTIGESPRERTRTGMSRFGGGGPPRTVCGASLGCPRSGRTVAAKRCQSSRSGSSTVRRGPSPCR